jgi:hypothetical protein
MGLFSKAKEAQQQARDAMAGAGGMSGLAGAVKGMGPADMDEKLRYRDKAQKLKASGVEAPGVINTLTPGEKEFGGSISTVFDVTIAPADGAPYAATIKQAMLESALADLHSGDAITVRYDPDEPTSALIYSW